MTRLTTNKCLEAWTNCLEQLDVKADIVFIGDSLTYYGKFSGVFPYYKVVNLGLRGDNLEGVISRLGQISVLHPSKLFIMIGLNDLGVIPLHAFYRHYSDLVARLLDLLPPKSLFLQSILPVNSIDFKISCDNRQVVEYNSVIQRVACENQVSYLNVYESYACNDKLPSQLTTDGIHLKKDAYSIWYSALRDSTII